MMMTSSWGDPSMRHLDNRGGGEGGYYVSSSSSSSRRGGGGVVVVVVVVVVVIVNVMGMSYVEDDTLSPPLLII